MYPNRREPPEPIQSSTPTRGEHIGSEPENNVNAPGGNDTVVNVTGKDGNILQRGISFVIGKGSENTIRIGRGLHPPNAPSTSHVKLPSIIKRSYSTSRETNSMPPIPVASSHSAQGDSGKCPVCQEPLNFSVRLPDEKPHIVPECGHAVHEACFTAAYVQKSNLGVCGECRRPMKVADDKSNKLAVLTGMGDSHFFPGRDTSVARNRAAAKQHDPSDDDVLEYNSTKSAQSEDGQYIAAPSIHVHPEFSHLTRTNDTNQPLTCVVVIELPVPENYGKLRSQHSSSGPSSPQPDNIPRYRKDHGLDESFQNQRQLSDTHYASTSNGPQTHNYGPNTIIHSEDDSPFHAIAEDPRNRIIDRKGHPLSDIGPLQMYDFLSVRRKSALREFYVYLFKEAIICVVEEKTHGLRSQATSSKGLLLKEIIYVRRIKNVIASSAAGDITLTIDMEGEQASFILIFKDRASLGCWKNNIQALVNLHHAQNRMVRDQESERPPETLGSRQNKLAPLREDDELSNHNDSQTNLVTPHTTSSGSPKFSAPLPHLQMDLILVISVPPPNSQPNTLQLKIRVIKTTLHFLVASLGPKDRLSVVTFEVGMGGNVRKTPFLMMGRPHSRVRLEKFIDETGVKLDESEDEFLVRGSKTEKTDVVTAVNHGLDVVLQRKERNPVSGLILISDASDGIRRTHLVLARAESANVPIHSFGYGRSHDPAPLLVMSKNTSGTYTFVKDWYDLRNCVAGCVGGMMSIGLLNMKLHLKVVDNYRFKIRKVSGGSQFILSDDGQSLEMDVGELRYGEKKEMLVELEVDNNDQQRHAQRRAGRHQGMNTMDQFVQSFDEGPDLVDGMMDRMIEEVPVLEVDGSFLDPAAAKNISRLAPVLLTTTFLPASPTSQTPPSAVSDPVIVRRRMELLASDMITRALVLVSKRNLSQAQTILAETNHILHTTSRSLAPHTSGSGSRNRKELMLTAVEAMQAILEDLQLLSEALEDNVELFAHDQWNFGAQRAMILRNQKSWSGRSATERLFWTTDNSIELVSRSAGWVASDSGYYGRRRG